MRKATQGVFDKYAARVGLDQVKVVQANDEAVGTWRATGQGGRCEVLAILKTADRAVSLTLEVVCGAMVLAIAALTNVQILTRVGINISFGWTEELLKLMLLYVVFLSSVLIFKKKGHIRVDFISTRFEGKVARAYEFVVNLLVFGCCVFLTWFGVEFWAMLKGSGTTINLLGWPAHLAVLSLPLGMGLYGVYLFAALVGEVAPLARSVPDRRTATADVVEADVF